MRLDILMPQSMRARPAALMESLCASAAARGIDAVTMKDYAPRAGSVLVLYGLGGSDRLPHALEHQRSGGQVVSWDAGYWERKTEDRRYRVSIGGFHCPQRIMLGSDPGPDRLHQSAIQITDQSHPKGNIVLIGNGPKSGAVGAAGWAAKKSAEIRRLCKYRPIVYRPKRRYMEPCVQSDGVDCDSPIEDVLKSTSLVVCRHSNVAVDACRMGIPVVCEDGAAAAIYPSRLQHEASQPSHATRAEFLRRLAWWQWSESEVESGAVWPWLLNQL
jgi:hypothetical protein